MGVVAIIKKIPSAIRTVVNGIRRVPNLERKLSVVLNIAGIVFRYIQVLRLCYDRNDKLRSALRIVATLSLIFFIESVFGVSLLFLAYPLILGIPQQFLAA